MNNPFIVGSLALLCCFLWGSAFPCVKIGYEWFRITDVGSKILFAGYRFVLAGILTFLIGCVLERRLLLMKKTSIPYVFGQGILQTTMQYLFFYIGIGNTSGAKGSIINALNVFVAIIAAHIMLKNEKMTRQKWFGCTLGILGVMAVNLTPGAWGAGFSIKGEGMIAICALAYGISHATLKLIAHRETAVTITAWQLLFGGMILLVTGRLLGGKVEGFTIKPTLLLVYMALISTIAFSVWAVLLNYNTVGRVSIYAFTVPIFGVVLSGLLLGDEVISLKNLIALVLVSSGIVIVNRNENIRKTGSG